MGVYTILYPNRTDTSTLSGGSWDASAPLTRMQDNRLKVIARSNDLLPASTQFQITLDKDRQVGGLALVNHNFTTDATWRVRAYTDAGLTQLAYDSGQVNVYPAFATPLELEWEDDNFWSGKPLEENIEGLTQTAIDLLGGVTVTAQYWLVEIFDSTNPSGFVSIGRLFIGANFLNETLNANIGATSGIENRTRAFETPGGHIEYDVREPIRTNDFQYRLIENSRAYSRFLQLEYQAGIDKEVFLIQDADDSQNLLLRSYLGTIAQPTGLGQNTYNTADKSFRIQEKI